MSYYNAGQITLRHPMSHGLMMDLSYTLSNSIDMGSDTERSTENGTNGSNSGSFSTIQNTWKPYLNRGHSDFDTRHLITADWVYQLPVGRGKALAGGANGLLDAFIGGWQSSGITRWTSGLPFTLTEPGWTTNWEQEAYGVVTGDAKIRKHRDANGNMQFFDDPDAINNGVYTGGPVRLPYPGEAGQRNNFRGDGYFDIDSGTQQDPGRFARPAPSISPGKFTTSSTRFALTPHGSALASPMVVSESPRRPSQRRAGCSSACATTSNQPQHNNAGGASAPSAFSFSPNCFRPPHRPVSGK